MKREKYSLYYVTSAIHGGHFCVPSELHEALVIKAETTPNLLTYKLDGPTFRYEKDGQELTTTVPMTASLAGGATQHWDVSDGPKGAKPSLARQVKEAHAAASNVERVLLCRDELRTNQLEWGNRKLAHTYLFQGRNFDTVKLEATALMTMHKRPASLGEMAQQLGLTAAQGYLVFLRCWMKGRFRWDIATVPLGLGLSVGR
jgi:hypothetical protein